MTLQPNGFAQGALSVSNGRCLVQGNDVEVTGALVSSVNGIEYSGPGAVIYNSSGQEIGAGEHRGVMAVNPGSSTDFDFTVTIGGTPASCSIHWGAGPPPGVPGL